VGIIPSKPTTQDALEAKGALATGGQWDLVVQAQIAAAINRHAIDLNLAVGAMQDFATPSKYYITSPYNWYCKFWHRTDISYNSKTYSFAYDDVFNQSSTINAGSPLRATITIGGFSGTTPPPPTGNAIVYKDCNYTGYAVGLNTGTYTLAQLNALGVLNDDISSLKVSAGYKVTLYENDGFAGASLVQTADNSCLVGAGWNDRASSLKVESNTASFNTKIEAESYISMAGVQTEACSEGTLNVGWIDAGDWMAYNITIPTAGTYRFIYRVASPNAGKTLRLEKDAGATQLGTVTIPTTGGWQTWMNVAHNVTLPAGTYSFGIATATGGFNINYITVTSNLSAREGQVVELTPEMEESPYVLSPNPVKDQIFIKDFAKVKRIKVYNIQGQEMISVENPGSSISVQTLKPGLHIAIMERHDNSIRKEKLVKE
jgi:hypothetical protein